MSRLRNWFVVLGVLLSLAGGSAPASAARIDEATLAGLGLRTTGPTLTFDGDSGLLGFGSFSVSGSLLTSSVFIDGVPAFGDNDFSLSVIEPLTSTSLGAPDNSSTLVTSMDGTVDILFEGLTGTGQLSGITKALASITFSGLQEDPLVLAGGVVPTTATPAQITLTEVAAIPLPAGLPLLLTAFAALGGLAMGRRRRRA